MSTATRIWSFLSGLYPDREEKYELDEEWNQLLGRLREQVKEEGFNLEENEELYLSVMAHVAKENEEGLKQLAKEEVAQKAHMEGSSKFEGEDGVNIKTIEPKKPE
jgi:hypothetical protein